MKRRLGDGRDVLILEPRDLLRRLATLVPPPRAHLVRCHGVFGPASKWRREIVPAPAQSTCPPEAPCSSNAQGTSRPPLATKPPRPLDSRIPWSELLLRVFREDLLACPCGGRRKVIAFIDERPVIERKSLGTSACPLPGPRTLRLAYRRSPRPRSGKTISPSCSNRCADVPARPIS